MIKGTRFWEKIRTYKKLYFRHRRKGGRTETGGSGQVGVHSWAGLMVLEFLEGGEGSNGLKVLKNPYHQGPGSLGGKGE